MDGYAIFSMLIVGLLALLGFAQLACGIMVGVKGLQGREEDKVLAIVSLVCAFFFGLVTYVIGWVKVDDWQTRKIMLVWTGLFVFTLVVGIGFFALALVSST